MKQAWWRNELCGVLTGCWPATISKVQTKTLEVAVIYLSQYICGRALWQVASTARQVCQQYAVADPDIERFMK
jgi:hypothetical protein